MANRDERYQQILAGVAPYAHPDHWDGHTFGVGDLTPPSGGPSWAPKAAADLSQEVLRRFMNHPGVRYAQETFRVGQTFDAGQYNAGTILAVRHEELRSNNVPRVSKLLADIACEPPDVDLSLPPQTKDFRPYCQTIQDKPLTFNGKSSISYWNQALWGVVAADRKGNPLIVKVPPDNVERSSKGVTVYGSTALLWPEIKIGEVKHTKRGRTEYLGRVSLLEVCSYGYAKRSRRRVMVLDLARKFAEGTA